MTATDRFTAFLDSLPRDQRDTADAALVPGRTYTFTVKAARNKAWTATYTGTLVRIKKAGAVLVVNVHGHDTELAAACITDTKGA